MDSRKSHAADFAGRGIFITAVIQPSPLINVNRNITTALCMSIDNLRGIFVVKNIKAPLKPEIVKRSRAIFDFVD